MTHADAPFAGGAVPAVMPEPANAEPTPQLLQGTGAPPAVPGQEDLLGPRIAAALIDIVVLTGVYLILGLTVGEHSTAVGPGSISMSITLGGMWLVVYWALVLLYFFAFEATIGQTVGKRLLGLRITRLDGSRPSTAAIAGRTLLRIVDWLPMMYLVGFIVMLCTGVRRQRVGDLLTATVVTRASPAQRRSLAWVPLALVLLAVIGLLVYRAASAEEVKTYRGHGVSFDYPAQWRELDTESLGSVDEAEDLWNTAVGIGGYNMVTIHAYRLDTAVTPQNVDAVEADLEEMLRDFYQQSGGTVHAGPEQITGGGKPGVRFRSTGTVDGITMNKTDIFFFDGTTEYQLGCQSDPDHTQDIEHGCDQILRSFTLNTVAALQ